MAAGWSPIDALNKNSMAAAEDRPKARFRTRDISIKKMYSNEKNFYSMQDIDGLAQKILAAGLMENMTVAYEPCDRGIYKIIAGERRWRALNKLVEDGYKEFEIVTCQIKNAAEENEEIVQIIIANSYRDKSIEEMLEEEKQLKKALQYMRDNGLELQGYDLNKGRLRDVIASIMQKSTGKIAQIEKINSNLIPELQKEVREGRLNFSAAHEISGLSQEKQQELFEKYEKGGLSVKEAKQAKEEEKEEAAEDPEEYQEEEQPEETETGQQEDWEDAHPESITSLCYSCQKYQECNVKTGTCQKCDQYVNKAEAEKTEEDRYNEEQDRLDRESKKKLKEQEQEERMQQLPSDEQEDKKERAMRVAEQVYKDIETGQIRHMIVKIGIDQYKEKDILTMLEFKDGRSTGRQMRVCVTCVDTAETSSAIVDGYAVLGIMDVYDAEQMGLIDLEDED